MYINRHAERIVQELAQMFGAVLVAGPRQVGKTTMLARLTDGMNSATLDDPILRANAEEESGTFFKDNPPPVFVDEIQKAPALFEQMKLYLDRERKKGQFFLCGSQQFKMMKGVSESLAECSCSVKKQHKKDKDSRPHYSVKMSRKLCKSY